MTGTGNQMLKEKGDIKVNRENMKEIIKGSMWQWMARQWMAINSCHPVTAEAAQTGPILFLTRYWVVFHRRQNKSASHAAKARTGEKMLQITPKTKVSSPVELKDRTWAGHDRNLNAGTLSEAKGLLSMMIRCWNPFISRRESWIRETDLSLASVTILPALLSVPPLSPSHH